MSWPLVKLGELVDIKGGGTPSKRVEKYWNGDIPWASVKDFKGSLITKTQNYITREGVENSATNIIPAGTLIVPTRMALGKVALTGCDMAINQDVKALLIKDKNQLSTDYLLRFLGNSSGFIEAQGQGATVKGIKLEVLRELALPLPPLAEQKRIAAILDKADQLRQKRQQAIALADDFLRSVFLDMFGDLAFNPYDYQRVSLDSLSVNDGIKCGPFGTQLGKHEYLAEGVPLWGIKHVNRDFKVETDEYLSAPKAIALKAYSIRPDDIVMTRKGTVGNCHVYPEHMPEGIMHSDLLRIRVDESIIDPYFLSWQLKLSRDVSHQISLISSGAIMAGINVTKLKNIEVYVPEVTQQIKFREILFKKGELTQKYSQGDLALFDALSQKAFAGEL